MEYEDTLCNKDVTFSGKTYKFINDLQAFPKRVRNDKVLAAMLVVNYYQQWILMRNLLCMIKIVTEY